MVISLDRNIDVFNLKEGDALYYFYIGSTKKGSYVMMQEDSGRLSPYKVKRHDNESATLICPTGKQITMDDYEFFARYRGEIQDVERGNIHAAMKDLQDIAV